MSYIIEMTFRTMHRLEGTWFMECGDSNNISFQEVETWSSSVPPSQCIESSID